MSPTSSSGQRWKSYSDVLAILRKRWERGQYLSEHLRGEPFDPVRVSLSAPSARELVERFGEVIDWSGSVLTAARAHGRVEARPMKTRSIGENDVPVAVWFDSFEQLVGALGARREVQLAEQLVAATREQLGSDAAEWVAAHPHQALAAESSWRGILAVVDWVAKTDVSALDLRHIDVGRAGESHGVDTKFVNAHSGVISRLLDTVLPDEKMHHERSGFAARYGFRSAPRYVRFRLLDNVDELPNGLSEFSLRVDELSSMPLSVDNVFIVENQATYLAFPNVRSSIVIFGGGFDVSTVAEIGWLRERRVIYWGDIDLAGFAILDTARRRLGNVESMLMDRQTLTSHLAHIVTDDKGKPAQLLRLTSEEAAVYSDLVEDRYGVSVRLEQERIRFSAVREALERFR